MKNILKIYKEDMKKIFTNYAALIVFIALSILPSLYAWFNIKACWDPYGKEATSQIKIGVVNELGDILYRSTCETDVKGGFNKIIADIKFAIENIINENYIEHGQIKSIGFGIPGYIDKHGKANCVNLNWKKVDFIYIRKVYLYG